MKWKLPLFSLLALLWGCATMPTGPTVHGDAGPRESPLRYSWPMTACAGNGRSGRSEERRRAKRPIRILPPGRLSERCSGAGVGAAIGSLSGQMGAGAAIGAGAGLLGGTAMASGPAYESQWQLQRRYDIAYQQCMYSKGNQIPGVRRAVRAYPPPQSAGPGPLVVVPGQYVNGKWVPEHTVQFPPAPGGQAAPVPPGAGPYAPPPPQ